MCVSGRVKVKKKHLAKWWYFTNRGFYWNNGISLPRSYLLGAQVPINWPEESLSLNSASFHFPSYDFFASFQLNGLFSIRAGSFFRWPTRGCGRPKMMRNVETLCLVRSLKSMGWARAYTWFPRKQPEKFSKFWFCFSQVYQISFISQVHFAFFEEFHGCPVVWACIYSMSNPLESVLVT